MNADQITADAFSILNLSTINTMKEREQGNPSLYIGTIEIQ